MAEHLSPQQVLDLACQAQPKGNSLQALRLHLADCALCRRSLLEAEALQALAVEAAPEMDQAANRALAAEAGRLALRKQISEEAGEEAARQVMDEAPAAGKRSSMAPALAALAAALLLGGLLWWQNRREQQAMADLAAPAWPSLDATPSASAPPPQPQAFVPPTPLPAGLRESGADKAPTAADRAAKKLLIRHSRAASKKRRHAAAKKPAPAAAPTAAPTPAPTAPPAPSPEPSPTAGGGPLVQAPGGLGDASDPSQQPASLEVINTRCAPAEHQLAQLAVVAPGPAQVELRIFTIHSRSVRLILLELAQAGRLDLSWNGQDDQGVDLPAGIYYARVTTPWFMRTETLELAR